MDWRDRFRAPFVIYAAVARVNANRGVIISDVEGRYQAYGWDRSVRSISRVTSTEAAVTSTAISPDGEKVYAMVEETPGAEIGHLHSYPFEGGEPTDLTPDLDPYTAYYFRTTDGGVVALAGLGGRQGLLVVDSDDVRIFDLPSLPLGLVVDPDDETAAVTLATPGKGLVPMLRLLDLGTGDTVAEIAEMEGGAMHSGRVAVAFVEGEWKRPGIWDGETLTKIDVDVPGDVVPTDWSEDGTTVLLAQSYRSQGSLFLYDVASAAVKKLVSPPGARHPFDDPSLIGEDIVLSIWSDANNPWRAVELTPDAWRPALELEGQQTFTGPQWEEFTFTSTQGVQIQGWLLRPEGKGPWPTVVYTHGGPSSVAGPIFSPVCSAWFDQGFAVASINYRGSITFGESFREALTGNIGGPDIDDVVAAHRWLVNEAIADAQRVVKNGYSYGGYLTLQALGTHPELWAAGVAGAPIADWAVNYEDSNDLLKGYDLSLFGGPPEEMPDLYQKASPRTYVDRFKAPVLISQPETDSRTPLRQVQVFVDDLRALGKEVRLDILEAGHAGSGKDQTIAMVESWLDFAASVVG